MNNNREYLIAALKKEAEFHADLAKEKMAVDDTNYHLRKTALFTKCADALRNAQGEREGALMEALKFYADKSKWHQFTVMSGDIGGAREGDFAMAFDDGEDMPWSIAERALLNQKAEQEIKPSDLRTPLTASIHAEELRQGQAALNQEIRSDMNDLVGKLRSQAEPTKSVEETGYKELLSSALLTNKPKAETYTADELKQWWPAVCPKCHWKGLSRDCAGGGQIADTGDYDDVSCPICGELVEDDSPEAETTKPVGETGYKELFSGDYSRDMWAKIDSVTDEEASEALYLVCCRIQEMETQLKKLIGG
jgi:hypothetical protein